MTSFRKIINVLFFILVIALIGIVLVFSIALLNNTFNNTMKKEAQNYALLSSNEVDAEVALYHEKFLEETENGLDEFAYLNYSQLSTDLKNSLKTNSVDIVKGKDINLDSELYFIVYFIQKEGINYSFYIEAEKVFRAIEYDNVSKILLTLDNGLVVYSKDELSFTELGVYLRNYNDSEDIDNFLNSMRTNDKVGYAIKYNKEEAVATSVKVQSLKGLNAVTICPKSILSINYSDLYLPFMCIGAVVIVIIIIGLSAVNIMFNRKYREVKFNKFAANKSQAIIIRVRKDGYIYFKNLCFNILVAHANKIHNINEFKVLNSSASPIEHLREKAPFELVCTSKKGKPLLIHFIIINTFYSYELIGENYTEKNTEYEYMIEQTRFNHITHENNLHVLSQKFDDIVESFKKGQKTSFILFEILDVDKITKLFSHSISNDIIKEIYEFLKSTFDENKVIYHVQDESFLVIFKNYFDEYDPVEYTRRVLDRFIRPFVVSSHRLNVRVKASILNLGTEDAEELTLDTIVKDLEITIRRISKNYNVNYLVFTKKTRSTFDRDELFENELKDAVSKNEFVMYYQPQFDNKTNLVNGFEALIRWNNPKHINESPQRFIELSEKNGLIIPIGNFIMNETFKTAKLLEDYNLHISMNISPSQIMQAGFVQELCRAFSDYGLKPGSIALEVTETMVMENFSEVVEKLKILKNKGFSMHLDDFGTGYSSMLYLRELPIDTIKIDKDFTKHMLTDKFSANIVIMISNLTKNLNLECICEGVETEEQNEFLKDNGVNIIQGFLIGKAMPLEKAIECVQKYQQEKAIKDSKESSKKQK